jgi:hypothetical protein
LAYRTYALNGAMTLGAEEPTYCKQNWIYHEIKEGNDWVLVAENFTFNGVEYEREVTVC